MAFQLFFGIPVAGGRFLATPDLSLLVLRVSYFDFRAIVLIIYDFYFSDVGKWYVVQAVDDELAFGELKWVLVVEVIVNIWRVNDLFRD